MVERRSRDAEGDAGVIYCYVAVPCRRKGARILALASLVAARDRDLVFLAMTASSIAKVDGSAHVYHSGCVNYLVFHCFPSLGGWWRLAQTRKAQVGVEREFVDVSSGPGGQSLLFQVG